MAASKTVEFDSIGSRFWLESLDNMPFSATLQQKVIRYCEQFDDRYSRFKDDSLISSLAKTGKLANPSAELLSMLEYAKSMYRVTDGVFNITVGAALHTMGYGDSAYAGKVLHNPWQKVTWNERLVRVPKGMMLDFGGFGKGWLIDGVSELLRAAGHEQFIVNGGGDLYVKSHTPVTITLEDPTNPGFALREVYIQDAALACSDIVKRSWVTPVGKKHHIVDPKSGDSSGNGVIASYVIAPTALVADTMATVLIVCPEQQRKLERDYDFTSIMITS